MSSLITSIHHHLLKPTSFFGVKLWVAILICVALAIVLSLSITVCFFLIFRCRGRRRNPSFVTNKHSITPKILGTPKSASTSSRMMMNKWLLSHNEWDIEMCNTNGTREKLAMHSDQCATDNGIRNDKGNPPLATMDTRAAAGKEYTLNEIETATNSFADDNIIGSGDYGVVYRGVLFDHTRVAVKKFLVSRGRMRDFPTEVKALWGMRHKNLVKFLGYCAEGMFSLVVYEYVDNGNLNHWLHENVYKLSLLTWKIRMSIIEGIAKGLAYLHEDSETAILHQHLKSTNILLDKQWNPKISDFGLSKFLDPECSSRFLAPQLGMSSYIAPEYGNDGCILPVKSDVYSFGILVMEIVSGRTPEHLIDWIKTMVSEEKFDEVLDPNLPTMPCLKELKRIILIALRCVDPDANNRPKMGDVIHMLEPRDLLLTDDVVIKRGISRRNSLKEDL